MPKLPVDKVELELHHIEGDDIYVAMIIPRNERGLDGEDRIARHTYLMTYGETLTLARRMLALVS